jgi:thiol-disulfide isomerase/thioredoxin
MGSSMRPLELHPAPCLQGDYQTDSLNILFVFQVNCPGCFLYGLPVLNKLHAQYGDRVSFLGLSTAFEDFDLNTQENTEKFLGSGEMTGETLRALKEKGISTYPEVPTFPVAMDARADVSFDFGAAARKICLLNPHYSISQEVEHKTLRNNVEVYLRSLEVLSMTFTLNQFKGTPTFVLFNQQRDVLWEQFGYVAFEEVRDNIERFSSNEHPSCPPKQTRP